MQLLVRGVLRFEILLRRGLLVTLIPKIVSEYSQQFLVCRDAFVIEFPPLALVVLHLHLRLYALVVPLTHEQLSVLLHGEII